MDYLSFQGILSNYFTAGVAVIGLDGLAIADYPEAPGRRGTYFGDRDYFRQVIATGKPFIDKPILGRALKRPVLTIGVPVLDANGKTRAVMTGITDLTAPNFLGVVSERSMTGQGEFFVNSLKDNMIIAATDRKRMMTALPARGVNLMTDRFADGFEGSGIAVSSEGISKLYSGARIEAADWLVLAALPTEVAFRPATVLRQYLFVAAGVMTLVAALVLRWMAGRALAPLDEAGLAMRRMTGGQMALAELPVGANDEVGALIASFNLLVRDRRHHETALAEGERRFRMLVESAPDAILVLSQGDIVYANAAALVLFGAGQRSDLAGGHLADHVHPDSRAALDERLATLDDERAPKAVLELRFARLDGGVVDVGVSAVAFRYVDQDGALIFIRDITGKKTGERALRASEARFRFLFDHMLEGFAYCRMLYEDGKPCDFVYLRVNPAFERLTGLVGVTGRRVSEILPGIRETSPDLFSLYGGVAAGGDPVRFETYVEELANWFSISVYSPEAECFVAVFDVVTERKRAEENQRRLNRALRLLSDCNTALIHAEREQSLLEEVCRLVVETGGYRMAWVGYADLDEPQSVRPICRAGDGEDILFAETVSWSGGEGGTGPTGAAIRSGEVRFQEVQGDSTAPLRPGVGTEPDLAGRGRASIIALPLMVEKVVFGALTIHSDSPDSFIADEVQLLRELADDLSFGIETLRGRCQRAIVEEKLAFLAHHDPLTQLPNRLLLRDRFDQAVAHAARERSVIALMFLDIDHFKGVNDTLGHEIGDRLLVQMVQRLRQRIRVTDTVSRQGGDEFIMLVGNIQDTSSIARIAQDIIDAAAEPFEIGDDALNISASIGISVYPQDGDDFETLFKHADTALYRAKADGRNTFRFFAPTMNVEALARARLQNSLRQALKDEEFRLHYQPQVELAGWRVIGVEALVRWQRPGEGLVPPGQFVPAAERSGQIIAIGEWVLNEACRQAQAWRNQGMAPLTIAVNISAIQFTRSDILATVALALERSGLDPRQLELELTESVLLEDAEKAIAVLDALRAMGVRLSIDDFGTGYSSLSYLRRLSVDKLKIDQSFVRGIADGSGDAAIVKTIIDLAHTLGITVIAEGVETEPQLRFLTAQGCDEVQGFLFSRPLPPEEFPAKVVDIHARERTRLELG